MQPDILKKIMDHKKGELQARKQQLPEQELIRMINGAPVPKSFSKALRREDGIAIIAELKKASPSEGLLRATFDPPEIAASYHQAGANALSVLTDRRFFAGDIAYLTAIRSRVNLPLLRKDFLFDTYQLLEARAFGADAVLLIVAALSDKALEQLLVLTGQLGMQALVEVHNRRELERARTAGAHIIGINNRNLETFAVDLSITERLARLLSPEIILVAESGITSGEEVKRMKDAGAHAILVGSHFMRQADPGEALRQLKKEFQRCCG